MPKYFIGNAEYFINKITKQITPIDVIKKQLNWEKDYISYKHSFIYTELDAHNYLYTNFTSSSELKINGLKINNIKVYDYINNCSHSKIQYMTSPTIISKQTFLKYHKISYNYYDFLKTLNIYDKKIDKVLFKNLVFNLKYEFSKFKIPYKTLIVVENIIGKENLDIKQKNTIIFKVIEKKEIIYIADDKNNVIIDEALNLKDNTHIDFNTFIKTNNINLFNLNDNIINQDVDGLMECMNYFFT